MYLLQREARMAIVLDRPDATPEVKTKEAPGSVDELISTPFGKLTEVEIRQWEEVLGHPLRRWSK